MNKGQQVSFHSLFALQKSEHFYRANQDFAAAVQSHMSFAVLQQMLLGILHKTCSYVQWNILLLLLLSGSTKDFPRNMINEDIPHQKRGKNHNIPSLTFKMT